MSWNGVCARVCAMCVVCALCVRELCVCMSERAVTQAQARQGRDCSPADDKMGMRDASQFHECAHGAAKRMVAHHEYTPTGTGAPSGLTCVQIASDKLGMRESSCWLGLSPRRQVCCLRKRCGQKPSCLHTHLRRGQTIALLLPMPESTFHRQTSLHA